MVRCTTRDFYQRKSTSPIKLSWPNKRTFDIESCDSDSDSESWDGDNDSRSAKSESININQATEVLGSGSAIDEGKFNFKQINHSFWSNCKNSKFCFGKYGKFVFFYFDWVFPKYFLDNLFLFRK